MVTIGELKKYLEQFPDNTPVYIKKWSDHKMETYKEQLFLGDIDMDFHNDTPIVLFQMVV